MFNFFLVSDKKVRNTDAMEFQVKQVQLPGTLRV